MPRAPGELVRDLATTARLRSKLVRIMLRAAPRPSAAVTVAVLLRGFMPVVETVAGGVAVGAVPGALDRGFDSPSGERLLTALLVGASAFFLGQVGFAMLIATSKRVGRRVDRVIQQRAIAASLAPSGIQHLEERWFAEIGRAHG